MRFLLALPTAYCLLPSYCLVLACAIPTLGQQAAPLHVHVNLVNVAFSVRSADGVLVTNLTRDDVEVFEDGLPQKIEFFARSADLPLSLGLVADFSGSQEHFLKPHHHDLQTFLDTVLGPRDQAFLLGFGNHLRLLSDFSPSSSQLMQALAEYERGHGHYPELGPDDEDREAGTAFYDAIYYSVVEKLAGASDARKALIVFSDGEDNSSAHHMLDAIEAAQSENVRVFGIRYTEREHGHLTARNKYGTSVMHRIAEETGAADFDAREGDIQTWFEQIAEELRSSYELAYYPAAAASPDGSFHKITIRPKRAGLTVRCKTGYFVRTAGSQQ
ncbi:MAG TPA: VWA domain-containing protein [Terriglobia bacterium]|nr:VWA domain-containing protein [Terriglobia bacterium]